MPIVTREMSMRFLRAGYRPNCHICGRFIGEGGFYDVVYDEWNGGYEAGYSECRRHFLRQKNEEQRGLVEQED